jgi:hypothetical protein
LSDPKGWGIEAVANLCPTKEFVAWMWWKNEKFKLVNCSKTNTYIKLSRKKK